MYHKLSQSKLPSGAMLAPVIITSDKTQLTQFSGSKSAYPVYLTIGNIPKAMHQKPTKHTCVLIAYLSVNKISQVGLTCHEQTGRNQCLFHESMHHVLQPLMEAGKTGIEICGGDGAVHLVFLVLTSYVADYPEQCLVSCSKYGTCPKCQCPAKNLQDDVTWDRQTQTWTWNVISKAKSSSTKKSEFHKFCMEHEVSGSVYQPFLVNFPYSDIHCAIMPDILHQLYQGVFKHIVHCQLVMSPEELDLRIQTLPPAHGVHHFQNGISALSQISGSEKKTWDAFF
ncbi:hypothetical protein L208DRAFT_1259769 [Tricholoma matsutake]|nr:hypothetical protein L208DRAFT_1259769 [Tricholoma matsutake 945]